MLELPRPYLLFLGDVAEIGYAKTALGLRDWAPEHCIGEFVLPDGLSIGLPSLDPVQAKAAGARALIIGADVEIGSVAVMHKNRLIQVGDNLINEAVGFDPAGDGSKTRLASLVDALNALKVPTADVIDIIKMLKHKRALYGELIIE